MDPTELRNQARRWRARVAGHDQPTAQALVAAATSFEDLAEIQEAAVPRAAPRFIHRAYYDR